MPSSLIRVAMRRNTCFGVCVLLLWWRKRKGRVFIFVGQKENKNGGGAGKGKAPFVVCVWVVEGDFHFGGRGGGDKRTTTALMKGHAQRAFRTLAKRYMNAVKINPPRSRRADPSDAFLSTLSPETKKTSLFIATFPTPAKNWATNHQGDWTRKRSSQQLIRSHWGRQKTRCTMNRTAPAGDSTTSRLVNAFKSFLK